MESRGLERPLLHEARQPALLELLLPRGTWAKPQGRGRRGPSGFMEALSPAMRGHIRRDPAPRCCGSLAVGFRHEEEARYLLVSAHRSSETGFGQDVFPTLWEEVHPRLQCYQTLGSCLFPPTLVLACRLWILQQLGSAISVVFSGFTPVQTHTQAEVMSRQPFPGRLPSGSEIPSCLPASVNLL